MKEINDSVFNNMINESKVPVVVDFWAPWCGPCKMLGPVIEEISKEFAGKAEFVKLNVDENPVTSATYRISSIPTVLVFKDGKVVEQMVGFRPKATIVELVNKHI